MSQFFIKKSLGQNFLHNEGILKRIVEAAEITKDDHVVEVGPGKGALTQYLVEKAGKVTAIEKDSQLLPFLKLDFDKAKNLELIRGDALELPPPTTPYLLVANLPYYITSPLLDHFVRDNPTHLPTRAVILIQKEVADKLCAEPPKMNVLALHVQPFGKPRILFKVGPGNFTPAPSVESAVVRIDFSLKAKKPSARYFELVHAAFQNKRKMLRKTLGAKLVEKAGIDSTRRPETLNVEEWIKLSETEL
ncbi:ribosomal RNA small subunit methyltransferase A [Candidatus Peregrinibacteria bacterium CG_4_9_14_0_2_um_filter_53_11]|nr:MAG: ribosomal RNA small subunit methyltransferase A [Candidatus Peregrinibacteria bacterium CG_4_9_14_0_2_um_filter_53_11]